MELDIKNNPFFLERVFVDVIDMKKLIDITTTATLRPEILENTYKSFWDQLSKESKNEYNFRLTINIDPIGDERYTQQDVLEVAEKYFGKNKVWHIMPSTNNFAYAVQCLWSGTESKYVFHLEDTWQFNKCIDLNKLVYIIDNYPNIAYINFFKGRLTDTSPKPTFYSTYNTKEDRKLFLQIDRPLLSPGLFRGEFVREISNLMSKTDNPELQIWGHSKEVGDYKASDKLQECLNGWDYVIYTEYWRLPFWYFAQKEVDATMGRKWKTKHNFRKKTPFSPWEKIEKNA